MKMKKILLSFSLIMILCLSLGANVEATVVKSAANKPKDIKSIKVDKITNTKNSRGLKDITLEEFFKKINNKKEEELIKKIVVGSEPESILILKEKDKELYTLMVHKNVDPSDIFDNASIIFDYDFTKGNSNKSLTLGNYFELLDLLDKINSKVLFKNVVDYIDNKELSSQIVPYAVNCADVIYNNANEFAMDSRLKNSKEYYSKSQITTDNKGCIGVNLNTIKGKVNYFIMIVKF
ncbi:MULTISPECIES: hypothetical protein [unclassified Clostridium]|uniref:hypothetical protein n=1 Tax=unclassified Clostridium TaxID=2614128 RepID=UPI0025BCB014|nr:MULTISPECIES: hypothetical protein [unclassified Clostridium]